MIKKIKPNQRISVYADQDQVSTLEGNVVTEINELGEYEVVLDNGDLIKVHYGDICDFEHFKIVTSKRRIKFNTLEEAVTAAISMHSDLDRRRINPFSQINIFHYDELGCPSFVKEIRP